MARTLVEPGSCFWQSTGRVPRRVPRNAEPASQPNAGSGGSKGATNISHGCDKEADPAQEYRVKKDQSKPYSQSPPLENTLKTLGERA